MGLHGISIEITLSFSLRGPLSRKKNNSAVKHTAFKEKLFASPLLIEKYRPPLDWPQLFD